MMKKEDFEKTVKFLHEELRKRDAIIDDLKRQNSILLKTALKNTEKRSLEREIRDKDDKGHK